jgi:G3E family GTPase
MVVLENSMHLLLFSGFLGSGKTTLVIKLAKYVVEQGKKVAILVNEIGEVGIDNQLMRQLDLNVWELLNGCICCTLSADLVTTLQQLDSDYAPDLVIVEPSGAADPKSILMALPYYKGTPLESIFTISVLDPLRLEILIEVMTPLIVSQIGHADLVLVTKCDQAKPEEIEFAHQVAQEHNPAAKVVDLGKDTSLSIILKEILPWLN